MDDESVLNPAKNKHDLLETLVNESKDGIIVIDLKGIIRYANPSAEAIFGSRIGNLVGFNFGIPVFKTNFEFCLLDEKRTILEIHASEFDFKDETAFLLMVRNITKRVKTEKERKAQEQLLHETGEMARVGAWQLNLEDERFWWSPVCREIHGVDVDYDPYLKDAVSFFPEDVRETVQSAFLRCRKNGESFDMELPFITAQGDQLWVHSIGHPVYDNGKVIAIKGTCQDITSLHKTHQKLIQSETRTQKLFENAIQGFVLTEVIYDGQHEPVDYKILDVNHAFEDILGISKEQAIGELSTELIPGVSNTTAWDVFRRVAVTGKPERLEFYFEPFDTYFFVSTYQPFDGQLAMIFSDITERVEAQAELEKSEKKYRQMFENSINGFALHEIILDENGKPVDFRFLDVNAAFEDHTGIKVEDAIGKLGSEILPGIEETDLIDVYGQIALNGESKRFEFYYEPLDRYYTISAFSPEYMQFVTIFTDISDRILSKEAIQKSERRYRLLFENAFNGFIVVSLINNKRGEPVDYVYKEMNAAFEALTGLKAEEILNQKATDVTEYILDTDILENLNDIAKTGEAKQYEMFVPEINKYILVSSYLTSEGHIASILSDITPQMEAENKIRQNEEKYRMLFESMTQGVIYFNAEGRITSVNPAATRLIGLSAEELIGRTPMELHIQRYKMNGEPISDGQHFIFTALQTGEAIENISFGMFNPKRKEVIWLDISVIPQFRDGEEKPYQVFTTFLEITDQVRIQHALEERIKELRCLANVSRIIQERESLDEICVSIGEEIVQGMQFPDQTVVKIELAGKKFSTDDRFKSTPFKLSVAVQIQKATLGKITVYYREEKPFLIPEELNLLEAIAERLAFKYHQNETQDLLEESELRFRNSFMNAPNPIMIHAYDGEVIDVNQAWLQGSGYSRDEIVTVEQWMKMAHPEEFGRIEQLIDESFENERTEVDGVYEVHTKFGEIRYWHFNSAPLGNLPDGRQLVITLAIDITNRVLAEEEKDHYNNRLTALREIDQMMVSTLDLDQVLDLTTTRLGNLVQFDSMAVLLLDDGLLKMIACQGFKDPEEILKLQFPNEPGFPNYDVVENVMPLSLIDVSKKYPKFMQPGKKQLPGEIKAWLGVPLVNREKVIGMFTIDRLEERPFTQQDIDVAMLFANRAAIAITNAQMFERITSQVGKLEILRKIDSSITTSIDLNDALETILTEVKNGLKIDIASVFLYNEKENKLDYADGIGYRTKGHPKITVNIGQGYVGSVAEKMTPVFIPQVDYSYDYYRYPFDMKREKVISYYGFPLVSKGKLQGVLQILHRSRLEPDAEWIEFAETLARQTAIAVDNLTLFRDLAKTNADLREAYDATIEGWAHALEIRDKETEGHSRRVEKLTVEVAKIYGFAPESLVNIRRGVLLHDIGKMGIPDQILHKPGPLSEEEWVVMRQHPAYAFDMLKSIDYLVPALTIPHYHHERWNGSGYPEGLKGDKIPLEARIFAVVDVWDALTNDRPYRKAWTEEKTAEYLRQQAGKEFDPQVVEIFLDIIDK